jgi:hypothetical protein
MQKHFVHYVLIILLAVAPMQSVLAGLSALEFASACPMLDTATNEHVDRGVNAVADTGHDQSGMVDAQCDCCSDCLTTCAAMSQQTLVLGSEQFIAQQQTELNIPHYTMVVSSQYPPIDIRPPKVLH